MATSEIKSVGGNQVVSVRFPGDIDYIPEIRKFVSSIIHLNQFSRRFSFRTEIIIDELCNNAVKFGRLEIGECIQLVCRIKADAVVLDVMNSRAEDGHLRKLEAAIQEESNPEKSESAAPGRGIRIVKILSDQVELVDEGQTCVRVTKKKEEKELALQG